MTEIEQLREGMSKAYARHGDGFVNCAIESCRFAAEELECILFRRVAGPPLKEVLVARIAELRGEETTVEPKAEVPRTEAEWHEFLTATWNRAYLDPKQSYRMYPKEAIYARALSSLPLSPPDPAMVTVRREDLTDVLSKFGANPSCYKSVNRMLAALAPPKAKECAHEVCWERCEKCLMKRQVSPTIGPWQPAELRGAANADQT